MPGSWRILSSRRLTVFLNFTFQFSSVQFSRSVVSDSLWPHELQHARPPCHITNSRSSLKLTSIESVMPFSHLILCRPLLLLPPIPPSIRVFSTESTLHMRWPKYWSFSFSIIPSKAGCLSSGSTCVHSSWTRASARMPWQGSLRPSLQASRVLIFLKFATKPPWLPPAT